MGIFVLYWTTLLMLRVVLDNVFGVTGGKYRYFLVVFDNVISVTGCISQRY